MGRPDFLTGRTRLSGPPVRIRPRFDFLLSLVAVLKPLNVDYKQKGSVGGPQVCQPVGAKARRKRSPPPRFDLKVA